MEKHNIPLLDLKRQYQPLRLEIENAVKQCLSSQQFILGPEVERFEKEMAEYIGAPYALGISSGTDALLLSLMALDIGPGDEVITSPFTFFATAGCLARVGAKPIFVDIHAHTFNLDERLVEAAITSKTKAILPVHLFGQCCEMSAIMDLAKKHKLLVIEDAAQSLGAKNRGIQAGNFGDTGCYSFFPSKNLGGAGDSGLIVTHNRDLYEKMKILRVHGSHPKYYHSLIGGNFRLDALQAVILSIKLKHLNTWAEQRNHNARLYNQLLQDLPSPVLQTPTITADNYSVFNQYCILTEKRDKLKEYLQERGVGTEIYYPLALHEQECFQYLGYRQGDFPISEKSTKEILALPIFPELQADEINIVANTIKQFF